jgi:hypothetical protein
MPSSPTWRNRNDQLCQLYVAMSRITLHGKGKTPMRSLLILAFISCLSAVTVGSTPPLVGFGPDWDDHAVSVLSHDGAVGACYEDGQTFLVLDRTKVPSATEIRASYWNGATWTATAALPNIVENGIIAVPLDVVLGPRCRFGEAIGVRLATRAAPTDPWTDLPMSTDGKPAVVKNDFLQLPEITAVIPVYTATETGICGTVTLGFRDQSHVESTVATILVRTVGGTPVTMLDTTYSMKANQKKLTGRVYTTTLPMSLPSGTPACLYQGSMRFQQFDRYGESKLGKQAAFLVDLRTPPAAPTASQ